jgi:hypothetical protein
MTRNDACDASESLARLARLTPDAARAARVRVRCRAQLQRNRWRTERAAEISGFTWRVLGPVVVGGFCVLYVVALVATTFSLRDVLY